MQEPQYIVDRHGQRTGVILDLASYEELLAQAQQRTPANTTDRTADLLAAVRAQFTAALARQAATPGLHRASKIAGAAVNAPLGMDAQAFVREEREG